MDLPITSEEYLQETVPVGPGGTLHLDLDRGSVEISSHQQDEVEISAEARGWGAHLVVFHLDRRGDDVELDVDVDSWLAGLLLGTRVRVSVWVPPVYSVDVRTRGGSVRLENIGGRVAVRTSGGSVRARRVADSAHLQTSGGSIQVEEVRGDLRARTGGGSIRAEDIAGRVEARTNGGSIALGMVDGPVEARTLGGSIRVRFVDEPEGTIETGGGSIEVGFPEDAGAELDAKTGAGRIRIEHPHVVAGGGRRNELLAKVNGGGPPLVLRSGAGSISVRATSPRRETAATPWR